MKEEGPESKYMSLALNESDPTDGKTQEPEELTQLDKDYKPTKCV